MIKEYVGNTLEEVLAVAQEEEQASLDVLEYYIVDKHDDKVYVNVFELRDVIKFASNYVKDVISNFNLNADITVRYAEGVINLKVNTEHNSVLIGKGGETLQSITQLTRLAINTFFNQGHNNRRYKLLIDIGTYKERKYDQLTKQVRRIASQVLKDKQPVQLEPMTSDERRIIHNLLTDYPNLASFSKGFGDERHIVVSYKE
ncbi:MAG: KH domain-containing protein [Bacillales bacterium]|jgi:spoIIIJ-associated protein|nr:KH domain-containing protein [Bacillales bacterium]